MRHWKLALFFALFFTILWILAPSPSVRPSEPDVQQISFMAPGGPVSDAMAVAVLEFEEWSRAEYQRNPAHPIYRVVSGQNASRNPTEDPTRFLVSVAGGMPPDVIRFDRFAVTEWAARGAFEKLDPFIARDLASRLPDAIRPENYFKPAWDEVVFHDPRTGDTGIYAIPEKVDNRALFYNKDLLRRAGFVDTNGEARPPASWEELEEMALRLTEYDESGRIERLGFAPNIGNAWLYFYGWMNGGEFMGDGGRTCTLNSPPIVEALTWMVKMYDLVGGAERVSAFDAGRQVDALDPFITGRIAMKIDGFWTLGSTIARFGRDLNFGVAPPPLPRRELEKGQKAFSWLAGYSYAVPSTAKNKEGAWELIRFLSSRHAAELIAESNRLTFESQGLLFIPDQNANRDTNEWLFNKYVYSNPKVDPRIADAVRVFNGLIDGSRYRPVTPVGQLLWNQHRDATDAAIFKTASPKEALDHATQVVQRQLDRVLAPPKGRPFSFRLFIIAYVLLLLASIVIIVRRDPVTRAGPGTGGSLFRSQWKDGWICASPWILGFIIFTGGPLLFSILMSLSAYDVLTPPRFIGLENYRRMFSGDPLFWKSLANTFYMVLGIPLGMILSLGLAVLLNTKVRGLAVWRTFFYLPSIIPAVAASILWIWVFNPSAGLLNGVLGAFGISGPNWLQDARTSKPALILMGLWSAGGGMIIWLAGLKGISETYYEAAALDGASKWQQFTRITLPLLSPYILFNLIMGLIATFQIFTQAFIMTEGGPVNSTLFFAYHLFNNAFRYLDMGYACAMGWFLFIIVFALTYVQMRLSKRWVYYENE